MTFAAYFIFKDQSMHVFCQSSLANDICRWKTRLSRVMWFNTVVTLLLYQPTFGLRILQDSRSRVEHETEGSSCQHSENENYFDYISVDDEDYYEDGSAVGYIKEHEEFVDKGPPVFTDTLKKGDIEASSVNMPESNNNGEVKSQIENKTETSPFLPENLVLNNETHGSLNGKFLISNSGQGTILDLYFEDPENSTREHKEDSISDIDNSRNVILSSDVSSSSKCPFSIFVVYFYHLQSI